VQVGRMEYLVLQRQCPIRILGRRYVGLEIVVESFGKSSLQEHSEWEGTKRWLAVSRKFRSGCSLPTLRLGAPGLRI